uniref:Mercury resistance protein n=2 Tax=Thermorudis TaxID=1649508 RepID=A0A7C2WC02_9BACT
MKRWALVVLAALPCPCHLPIVLALLGGTVSGGALVAHQLWLFVAMSLIFTGAIAGLLRGGLYPAGASRRGPRIHRPARR